MNELKDITVSVVVPCYNEKDYIVSVIEKIRSSVVVNLEIILIDDYSTDGTREIIKDHVEPMVEKVIYHDKNMGKGASVRDGFKAVTGEIVIIQDADLEYDPKDYPRVLKPILDKKADVVYGSRFIGGQERRVLYFWHMIGNKFITLLSNMLTNLNLTDIECCYKAFHRSVVEKLHIKENRFGVEPEITARISKLHCSIFEVSVSYNGRTYSQGKKINWKDGVRAIWCILKYNLIK